jgi:hypothetical protein
VDYSEWVAPYAVRIATDNSGALYILSNPSAFFHRTVRRSADGSVTQEREAAEFVPADANNGTKTNCLTWPAVQIAPGVFTVAGTHAAALNEDGTINSAANPPVTASGRSPTRV